MKSNNCMNCKYRDTYREFGIAYPVCALLSVFIYDLDIKPDWCKIDELIIIK